ncbi:SDR family NAD(P)-dependent oxidoreductase [Lysinibacillus xylanilyticus]|uniref:SDR family NAD(P)-dependent oxidoreductase n=1 Tax=Lysinibacillus xylanilyticus TaxID=582475 RepID=UPI0036DA15E7
MKVAVVAGEVGSLGVSTINNLLKEDYLVFAVTLERPYSDDLINLNISDNLHFITGMSTDTESWAELSQTIVDICHGTGVQAKIDLLVNLAHVSIKGKAMNSSKYDLDYAMNQTIYSALTGINESLQLLQNASDATVVNVYPDFAENATDNLAQTNTKVSMDVLTKCLSQDLSNFGVSVTSLCYNPEYPDPIHIKDSVKQIDKNSSYNGMIINMDGFGIMRLQENQYEEVASL